MTTLKAYREDSGHLTVIDATGERITFLGLIEAAERFPNAFIDVVEPTTLHAHVETSTADCDGRINNDYVSRPVAGEDEYEFKERRLSMDVSASARLATLRITEEGYDWTEDTEEGFVNVQVEWCRDECSDERVYRDHSAEAAGY